MGKGLDELNGVNDQTKGGTILFMTDGGCNSNDYYRSTSERAKRNGVKVMSFALGYVNHSDSTWDKWVEYSAKLLVQLS